MQIPLPPDVERTLGVAEARLDLAVGMYAARRITLARAAGVAGISQVEFQRELGKRKIPTHYDLNDLADDLQALREMTNP